MDKYKFPCDPVANPASIISGDRYRFTILSDHVFRYEWAEDGVFEDRASTFAINRNFSVPEYKTTEADGLLHVVGRHFHLTYDKRRFSPNGLHVSLSSKTTLWGPEWRYGGEADNVNLGGTARTLDEVNGRCDMGEGILSRSGYASLDDSQSMLFDGEGFIAPRRPGDRIDGYFFCYGNDFKGAMRTFYAVSGRQPRIPRWALGNWWSRYHAYTASEYLDLMNRFGRNHVPLSVAVIDMDWHLVKGDEVPHAGWTGYTWNRSLFPDPEAFCKSLHDLGLKITLNDHPHAGIHHHEDQYDDMAKFLGHDTTDKAPILFNPTSPKFMDAYLNILHRWLETRGTCDFWWIDWQQGPYSAIPGVDPLWLLNHFHYLDHEQQQEKKQQQQSQGQQVTSKTASNAGPGALIFSRYAGPGSHRYPVGFSGDSVISWDSLAFQPEFTATASNIGYGWWSHDIGGHFGGYRSDELETRWVQLGVFSPIMRLHSSHSRWTSKEPWLYRKEHELVQSWFLQLRHRLVPYLDAMNLEAAAVDGVPLVRPMYWEYPAWDAAYRKPNQYFFGKSLVVAPIVQPRSSVTHHAAVEVWVPPGRYVDVLTGQVYDGDREIKMYRPLNLLPVIAPEGSIIPLDGNLQPGNGCFNPEKYEVLIVVGKNGEFIITEQSFNDAPDSKPNQSTERHYHINYDQAAGTVSFPDSKAWRFRFVSFFDDSATTVSNNSGQTIDCERRIGHYSPSSFMPGLVVEVPAAPDASGTGTIRLGPNPQLFTGGQESDRLQDYVRDCQIDFSDKDRIWEAYTSEGPATTKASGVLALGLDDEVVGPILEILLADNRS